MKKSDRLSKVLCAVLFVTTILFAMAPAVDNIVYYIVSPIVFAATLIAFLWTFPLTDLEVGDTIGWKRT